MSHFALIGIVFGSEMQTFRPHKHGSYLTEPIAVLMAAGVLAARYPLQP